MAAVTLALRSQESMVDGLRGSWAMNLKAPLDGKGRYDGGGQNSFRWVRYLGVGTNVASANRGPGIEGQRRVRLLA
jgi:hypothetical protein